MTAILLTAAAQFAPAATLALVMLLGRPVRGIGMIALIAALYFADALLLNIRTLAPTLAIPGESWNWEGKIAAALFAVVALLAMPKSMRANVGLFATPARSAWPRIAVLSVVVCGLALARTIAFGQAQTFNAETLAFQATLPGLHEELTFRGVWWVILAVALDPGRIAEGKTPWRTLLVMTTLFGAVHAIAFNGGALSVDWLFFAATAASGLLYGLLQGAARAVWIPILVHNLCNVLIYAWQVWGVAR